MYKGLKKTEGKEQSKNNHSLPHQEPTQSTNLIRGVDLPLYTCYLETLILPLYTFYLMTIDY